MIQHRKIRVALILHFALICALVMMSASPQAHAVTVDPSIPAAIDRQYDGGNLRLGKILSSNSAYTKYAMTYTGDGLTISGILNRPKGSGPFPVVVLAHGYIDPKVYVSGQGFRREQDWLARNGYVALHIDYRNHANSDKDPAADVSLRTGYASDVINAGLAIRASRHSFIDSSRVALLGRSMGGGVAYQAIVIKPGVYDAVITYAATSSNTVDNFNKWQRYDSHLGKQIIKQFGSPEGNAEFWRSLSARTYFSRVTEPILIIHGTEDESCSISWARETNKALRAAGKDVTLIEYKGAGHYFYGPWKDSIRQVRDFLKTNV